MLWKAKGTVVSLGEPTHRLPVLPGPAPPRRPAVRRPSPTRPWYVWVLDSTNMFIEYLGLYPGLRIRPRFSH